MNEKKKAIELTDEETEKAAGGGTLMSGSAQCPKCHKTYTFVLSNGHTATPPCPYCSNNTNDFQSCC